MITSKVLSLTPCQQQSLPLYCQGALSLLQSTRPINLDQACAAIREAYVWMGFPVPRVVFGQSPTAIDFGAVDAIPAVDAGQAVDASQVVDTNSWGEFLGDRLEAERDRLEQSIEAQISWPVQMALEESLRQPLLELPYSSQLQEQLHRNHPGIARHWQRAVKPELWLESLALGAFALEVLGCDYNLKAWQAMSGLAQHCGWLLPYEGVCFVSDRPYQLRLNRQGQLHGEGEAALAFRDGLALYAHGGVRLPEHYGRLHPHQWQSRWIGEEPDPALQQVLLAGIGYGRLVQELSGVMLDRVVDQVVDQWGENSLIRLTIAGLEEPLLLLKRCCPQTQVMDVLRVPPYLRSAQSAACWVHWNLPAVAV